MLKIRPFIRWAGGKTWLIPYLKEIIGDLEYRNYYEPFLGSGAAFFSLSPKNNSYLSDLNSELIKTYITIRDNPTGVINILQGYVNTESEYYRIRALEPCNDVEQAARFLYLNQTSYNGLYRVNKQGKYNVPYGFRDNWNYDYERLYLASKKLQGIRINCEDFAEKKYRIVARDLVFMDPPYTVSHNNNGFIEYNKDLFSLDDQRRLSKYIDYIKHKGAYYILANAAHESIREIFSKDGDRLIEVDRHSLIGGKNAKRERITEYIFTNILKGEQIDE